MMNKVSLIFALILVLSTQSAQAALGIDTADATNTFACMKSNGVSFAIIRAYRSIGALDSNASTTLKNAQAQGLITDIYHFPCLSVSASTQVSTVVNGINSSLYGTVWIDVESNPSSSCGWSSNVTTNCNFLTDLVNAYKKAGKLVGIYASKSQWQSIFGSATSCPNFTAIPIWYAHYDGNANFNDWSTYSFGGWKYPAIKQYKGDVTLCGTDVDLNYD